VRPATISNTVRFAGANIESSPFIEIPNVALAVPRRGTPFSSADQKIVFGDQRIASDAKR
jgi:hypothetical protein